MNSSVPGQFRSTKFGLNFREDSIGTVILKFDLNFRKDTYMTKQNNDDNPHNPLHEQSS